MNKIIPVFPYFFQAGPKIGVYPKTFLIRHFANQPVNFGILWNGDAGMI